MATKKTVKATTKKAAPKKSAAASTKTTVKRVTAKTETPKVVKAEATPVRKSSKKIDTTMPKNLVNIVVAEVIGTFILTLVAVVGSLYFMAPFYVGLALMMIVMAIGAISGAHINPAVTFGLWTMRKVKTVLVPFYWVSQFLGAMAAVVLLGAVSNGVFAVRFDHFMDFSWSIFAIELIGMAIFMFGIAAVISRSDIKSTGKAVGIGMSLVIGLISTGALLAYTQSAAVTKFQEDQAAQNTLQITSTEERTYPREVYIAGATLNPAVALAVNEKTNSQLQQSSPIVAKDEKAYTRLSFEVILATLIGAALGGNLFLLVNYRNKIEE